MHPKKAAQAEEVPPRRAELLKVAKALEEIERRKTYRRLDFFKPYPKQLEFFGQGKTHIERLFKAGNQLGKSEAGAFEAACHLTGLYPEWWPGRRWDRPTKGWMAGETSLVTRDVMQKKLCGEPGVEQSFGSGMVPKDFFVDKPSLSRGITDAYDSIQVKHVTGGVSVGRFKSYEQGRSKFQGETLDWIWLDEEPPYDLYSEGLTRTMATGGMVFITFTPLKGMSDVVKRFLNEPSPDRAVVNMSIEEAPHISEAEREKRIAAMPEHEREARAHGAPLLGEGKVFTAPEIMVREAAITNVPVSWAKIWGIDFGIMHPFAAALLAWDRDADMLHILHAFRMKNARAMDHAKVMKPWGTAIPIAWPRDGHNRDHGTGKPLTYYYKEEGLFMLPDFATWPDGGLSTEAGITEMHDRMTTGRFKVAAHLTEWWEEYRNYHRKDGLIVKEDDDLMSATRIGVMMKRYAKPVPIGFARTKLAGAIARGVDTSSHWGL